MKNLVLVIVSLGFLYGCSAMVESDDSDGTTDMTTLATGSSGTSQNNYYEVIDNESDFATVWEDLYSYDYNTGPPSVPEVNFNSLMVIVVARGLMSNGGYGIKIADYSNDGTNVIVMVTHINAGSSCIVADVLQNPFHIILVPLSDSEVEFVIKEETYDCEDQERKNSTRW